MLILERNPGEIMEKIWRNDGDFVNFMISPASEGRRNHAFLLSAAGAPLKTPDRKREKYVFAGFLKPAKT